MAYHDFQELKSQYSISRVAELLGLETKKSGNQLRCPDPTAEDSSERALAITPAKDVWYSFHHQKGGDQLQLIAHVKGISVKAAADWLVGDTETTPKKANKEERQASRGADQPSQGFRELDYLVHDHPAVDAVGFVPEDAQRIGAGYAPRGVLRGTVAVPIRSPDGKLLGYIGVCEATLPSTWHF